MFGDVCVYKYFLYDRHRSRWVHEWCNLLSDGGIGICDSKHGSKTTGDDIFVAVYVDDAGTIYDHYQRSDVGINDFDFTRPKVIVTERIAVLENITAIVMISEKALTVQSGRRYTTVVGEDFVIKEIGEGRLIIEGKVQRVEFL